MIERVLLTVMLVFSACVIAAGLDIHAAKRQGLVGELDTGYIGAVESSPGGDVRSLVADVNAKRKAQYEKIAARNEIALSDVEKLAAKKAIEKSAPGDYVNVGGNWRQK